MGTVLKEPPPAPVLRLLGQEQYLGVVTQRAMEAATVQGDEVVVWGEVLVCGCGCTGAGSSAGSIAYLAKP